MNGGPLQLDFMSTNRLLDKWKMVSQFLNTRIAVLSLRMAWSISTSTFFSQLAQTRFWVKLLVEIALPNSRSIISQIFEGCTQKCYENASPMHITPILPIKKSKPKLYNGHRHFCKVSSKFVPVYFWRHVHSAFCMRLFVFPIVRANPFISDSRFIRGGCTGSNASMFYTSVNFIFHERQ